MLRSRLPRLIRLYSKPPRTNPIDEFNKSKTSYLFGHNFSSLDELDKQIHKETPNSGPEPVNTTDLHSRIKLNFEQEEKDINKLLENDPRLLSLKQGSPDYKLMLNQVHEEFNKHQKESRKRFEFQERVKGVAAGVVFLVVVITGHYVLTNYEYVKGQFTSKYINPLNQSKASDLSDPKKNTKNLSYLLDKLSAELDDEAQKGLKNSKELSGLYVCGSPNGKKLPLRLSFFDNMLINDVKILKDYLVVINDKGQVYHFHSQLKEPVLTKLPFNVESCTLSNDTIYFLTNRGEVKYMPRLDRKVEFEPLQSRNWIGLSKTNLYNEIVIKEKIEKLTSGENHLLLLGKSGKVYVASTAPSTSDKFKNLGQFGMPNFSPFNDKAKEIPTNQAFEMTLLNNEIIKNKDGTKSLNPRKFISIASGKYHNVAADNLGNIWTWGKNLYGECGIDLTYKTDYQPIPKVVLTNSDFKRLTSSILARSTRPEDFKVSKVYAADDSSYAIVHYQDPDNSSKDQDIFIGFGNGVKGQLGSNKYLHVSSSPQLVKSIVNLSEFNENTQSVEKIGLKDVSVGNNHVFLTLDNGGNYKDVLAFGDNEQGQLGTGKKHKTCKPIQIPQLIEPEDVHEDDSSATKEQRRKKLAKRLDTVINSRLQLLDDYKLNSWGNKLQQVIVAGEDGSAIFYKRK
ncbi:RCC1/BLIP-II protein [Suhomyces tanzawaensis NRRL Y-17324]|uniref:RCC1/BLIP-II protein n=1 Tax=Suhomyces tanzawaensis NRRL Y-17324 TaxID=984487 RepID=A0A1E4SD19_9ASCO|nr:RCC1/BLIP-II protein [Suhomyces tanzawaensis NRRL Y-17324]ODV77411.1 RCC1/BLIP-II protein [Suhomyces tanzawaensis NRRL Y-17324]